MSLSLKTRTSPSCEAISYEAGSSIVSWEEMLLFSGPSALIYNYYSHYSSLSLYIQPAMENEQRACSVTLSIRSHTRTNVHAAHDPLCTVATVFHAVTSSHTAGGEGG